jgi:pyruvate dehydrogenase E2 component (dihydrolipoamide acetyltransferase)
MPGSGGTATEPVSRGEVEIVEPTAAERAIGRRAAESRATVPFLELGVEIEIGEPSGAAAVLSAVALALRETPRANAAYRDGRFELYSRVNVAVVIGDMAPTVFDADTKSIEELDRELAELAGRAARGELTSPELSSATATFADLGPLGVDRPSIVPALSQAVAIAAGAIRQRPVVRQGDIVPGRTMQLTLICDHRILYGAAAAAFAARIRELIEEPVRR